MSMMKKDQHWAIGWQAPKVKYVFPVWETEEKFQNFSFWHRPFQPRGQWGPQAGKHQFPEENKSCSKIVSSFCLHLQRDAAVVMISLHLGPYFISWIMCQNHATVQGVNLACEEFVPIYPTWHLPHQHRGSWEKMFLDLVAAYSLTLPTSSPSLPSPPPSHSHQRGKSSFLISSVSEIVKERGPQDVPEKARILWKGRRKTRELG